MKFCGEQTALLKMPIVYASTYISKYIKTHLSSGVAGLNKLELLETK